MRVANRRLRAAIAMFRTALPVRAVPIREELRWVAQALGVVRDLELVLEVGRRAQTAHDDPRADRAAEIDEQSVERLHGDVRVRAGHFGEKPEAFLDRK